MNWKRWTLLVVCVAAAQGLSLWLWIVFIRVVAGGCQCP